MYPLYNTKKNMIIFEFTNAAFFVLNYDYELGKAQIWHNYFGGEILAYTHLYICALSIPLSYPGQDNFLT